MEFNRETTIDWLESNQSNGAFEGFPEEDENFREMSDSELEYYFYNWVMADREEREEEEYES